MKDKPYSGWTILIDCDGCLTNGKKYIDEHGDRQLIAFHSRDAIACEMLIEMGFQVIVLTHSNFQGIHDYWRKYGAQVFTAPKGDRMTNKLNVNSHFVIDWEKTIGIGDDVTDLCYLEMTKFAFFPQDANVSMMKKLQKVGKRLMFQTQIPGGYGLLAAICADIQNGIINEYD